MSEPSIDFLKYMKAQECKRAARAQYDHAAAALDIACIHERLAEVKSQHEPFAGLLGQIMGDRDRLYAAAFYVVVGRMPEETKCT